MAVLQKKNLLEDQFLKAFALKKELKGEVISESNWHKRLAKRIYMIFRGREQYL